MGLRILACLPDNSAHLNFFGRLNGRTSIEKVNGEISDIAELLEFGFMIVAIIGKMLDLAKHCMAGGLEYHIKWDR